MKSAETVSRLDRKTLLAATSELCAGDGDLRGVVEQFGPPPLWARPPGFAALLRIILEQQVSVASARATFSRLKAVVEPVTADRVVKLSREDLRALGFTRQKAGYCLDLAARVDSGDLDLRRLSSGDDAAVRDTLLDIRGIGPWTADIYLLMALRRPDVWPEGDLALIAAIRRLKRLRSQPTADRIRGIASRWRPWRSVAARILWHFYLSKRLADKLVVTRTR